MLDLRCHAAKRSLSILGSLSFTPGCLSAHPVNLSLAISTFLILLAKFVGDEIKQHDILYTRYFDFAIFCALLFFSNLYALINLNMFRLVYLFSFVYLELLDNLLVT